MSALDHGAGLPAHRRIAVSVRRALCAGTASTLLTLSIAATAGELDRIELNAGAIDISLPGVQAQRRAVADFTGRRLHLVRFSGPTQNEWLDALGADGLRVVSYIPHYAYLVWGDAAAIARMQTRARGAANAIAWDGEWLDEYKFHPSVWQDASLPLAQRTAVGERFAVQLVADSGENAETLRWLASLGGKVLADPGALAGYENRVVHLDPSALVAFAARPDIVSIHPYVEPTLLDERQNMIVAGNLTGNAPNAGNYLSLLSQWGFTPQQFASSGFVVDVTDDGADINPAGGILTDDVSGPVLANHFVLWTDGNRPIGAATPTGTSRYVYKGRVGSASTGDGGQGFSGHGQLNMSIVGGSVPTGVRGGVDFGLFPHADAAGYRFGLGVAPYVRMANSVIFDPNFTSPAFGTLTNLGHANGARISSNSWGAAVGGAYNASAQTYDGLVRDARAGTAGNQELIIAFAAGNSGPGANTTGSPGTAKNVITVGAAENVHPFGGADGCNVADTGADSANDIINFSSRGPTDDQRVKPEIVAPGTHVTGMAFVTPTSIGNATAVAGYRGDGVCGGVGDVPFPSGQNWYTASSGTSHSTPAVAGGLALVYQQFINNPSYIGADRAPAGSAPPSPAMAKAYLVNAARYMTGVSANDTLPSNNQGMGMMNLGTAFDRTPRKLRDQAPADTFTATGQVRTFTGTVADPTKPFRVTLAWTDAPGPTSGNAFVNNLDLSVTVGGNTYLGNVFTGANSTTGGSADIRNNLESVFLPAGVTGPYTVTVTATNIAGQGIPGAATNSQDFALVVYNSGTASTCPAITVNPATLPAAVVDASYPAQTLTATGGTGPYTFAVTGGALPNGLTLSSAGTLSGTPTLEGTATFTATATDGASCTGSRTYQLPATCGISVGPATIPSTVVAGQAYPAQTFTATGGTAPYTFGVVGALPPGMTFAGGVLSGTPTTPGNYSFSVTAAGTGGSCVGVRSYTINVVAAVITLGARTLPTQNGIIEPGECNELNVVLNNTGTNGATAVSSTLSTTTPGVTIATATSTYPDIPNGGSASNATPFRISTDASVACFTSIALTQTVTLTGGNSPVTLNYNLPVGQQGDTYGFASGTGATIPAGGTLVASSSADDAVVDLVVPAGFSFSVYGTSVAGGSTLRASTNGNLQVVATGGSSAFSNTALPANVFAAAAPTIFLFWDDLDLRTTGGGIYSLVTGTAPNRRWIVEWRGKHFGDAGTTQTFNGAIVFREGSTTFELHYPQVAIGGANANGASATVGVQRANAGAGVATQFSFNTANVPQGLLLTATLPPAQCAPGPGVCSTTGDAIFAHGFESPAP